MADSPSLWAGSKPIASRMDLASVEVDTVATADLHLPLVLRR